MILLFIGFHYFLFLQLKHIVAAMISLKGLGGLLFILSSSLGAYLLV